MSVHRQLGLVHRSVVSGGAVSALQQWTSEVEAWPAGSHVWGHYAEQTASGEAICRTENVSACHAGFRSLVEGDLCELAASVVGADVVAFKDKVNYKQPGGAGFSPHQDLAAYPGAGDVVSFLVAIDECTKESGCLWVATGVDKLLDTDERGVVRAEVVADLDWSPIELAPGDALCIPGVLPHYSEANRSSVRAGCSWPALRQQPSTMDGTSTTRPAAPRWKKRAPVTGSSG